MRSFAIFLALIALAFAGIAFFSYPASLALQGLGLEFKFHRVASRVAMLTFLVGFVFVARRLRIGDRTSLGFALPAPEFLRAVIKGLLLGAVLMLPVLATMIALDMRVLKPDVMAPDMAEWGRLIAGGVATGLLVALLEETAMRGAMHTAIARESGPVAAIVLVSLVYAASHFFARTRIPAEQIGLRSGFDMLTGMLSAFANPLAFIDAFLCLFAVGALLGMVRHFTGNIAACIGLHASWVAIITVVRQTSLRHEDNAAFLMSDYDGFIGWMVLAWTLVIGAGLWGWYGRKAVHLLRHHA